MVIADPSEPIAGQLGSPYAVPLGPGPEPAGLVAKLNVKDCPAVLWGNWFGGGVVVLRSPLRRVSPATAVGVAALVYYPVTNLCVDRTPGFRALRALIKAPLSRSESHTRPIETHEELQVSF